MRQRRARSSRQAYSFLAAAAGVFLAAAAEVMFHAAAAAAWSKVSSCGSRGAQGLLLRQTPRVPPSPTPTSSAATDAPSLPTRSRSHRQHQKRLQSLNFNLDFTQDHIKGCMDLLFSSSYKSFRHKCYEHYVKSGDDARSTPYPPLIDNRVGDWIWLCGHFETEEFKKRSTIGKANRSNLPYVHKKGRKSFVAVQHELNCGDIRLYKECYSSDKKGWASEDARNKHEEMLQKKKEPIEEGKVPLTEQQICEQVLGKAYGYIRGRGHGPKPNRRAYSSASSSTQPVVEELASTKSVVSKLVGISPPMDGTSATRLGFTTDGSVLRSGYRSVSSNGSLVSDGGSRR